MERLAELQSELDQTKERLDRKERENAKLKQKIDSGNNQSKQSDRSNHSKERLLFDNSTLLQKTTIKLNEIVKETVGSQPKIASKKRRLDSYLADLEPPTKARNSLISVPKPTGLK